MRALAFLLWTVTGAGGIALYWWFSYGNWRLHGHTLIEHDEVRFGLLPTALSGLWVILLFVSIFSAIPPGHRR